MSRPETFGMALVSPMLYHDATKPGVITATESAFCPVVYATFTATVYNFWLIK